MPCARSALITGITGQDGSFLAELLLDKGYSVTGVIRGAAGAADGPLGCSEHLRGRVDLLPGELLEPDTLRAALETMIERMHVRELNGQHGCLEVYHLAAPSFVPASWERPREAMSAIVASTAAILEAVRDADRPVRVFVAASGGMFGEAPEAPQREDTPCRPTTPYAIAKLCAHQLVGAMRVHDGLHVSSGITFNHESERRPKQFVTRKITRAAAAISLGLQQELTLGALDAVRDWAFAGDIVYGAWLMLQQDQADDYVLASGVPHTVAELVASAFAAVELEPERYLRVDRSLVRPPESTPNVGDPGKARERLGWEPRLDFQALVERMVQADLRSLQAESSASR
ncbi:MAG: GDP-mannose 4,6-dehydratase [Solirubrobacteraceae bacterium]